MNVQSGSQLGPRRLGRSVAALLAGFVVGIVLSLGTDVALHKAGLAPPLSEVWSNQLLLLATAYRTVYSIVASYVVARLAPNRPMGHALVGGAIGFFVGILGAAVPILLFRSQMSMPVTSSMAMVFALLVAWDWFYHGERLILLGFGEISVRQAAVLIGIIDSVIFFFCAGWFFTLAMWCGGVAGWLYLTVRTKVFLGRTAQQIRSERVARLEL